MPAEGPQLTVQAAVQLLHDRHGAMANDAEVVLHLFVESHVDGDAGAVPVQIIMQPHLVMPWLHDTVTRLEQHDPLTAAVMARCCCTMLLGLLELEPVQSALGVRVVASLRKAWMFSEARRLKITTLTAGTSTAWKCAAPPQYQQQQGTAGTTISSSSIAARVVPNWLPQVFSAVQERCRVRPFLQVRMQWGPRIVASCRTGCSNAHGL